MRDGLLSALAAITAMAEHHNRIAFRTLHELRPLVDDARGAEIDVLLGELDQTLKVIHEGHRLYRLTVAATAPVAGQRPS